MIRRQSKGVRYFIFAVCLSLLAIMVISLASCSGASTSTSASQPQSKPVTLVFTSHDSPDNVYSSQVFTPWFAELEKRSGGKIKVEPHWNGELVSIMDAYNAAVAGTVDIANFFPGMIPGTFIADEISSFAPYDSNCWRASKIYADLLQQFPEFKNEYKDTHFIGAYVMYIRNFGTTKKAIRTVDDFKGLKTLSPGRWAGSRLEALGMVPVSMPPSDQYSGLQKGIIDSNGAASFILKDFKLGELYRYVTDMAYPQTVGVAVMSNKAWKSLSPDLQKAVDESSTWFMDNIDKIQLNIEKQRRDDNIKTFPNIEWTKLSKDDQTRMAGMDKQVFDAFAKELNGKGFPGTKMQEEYLKLVTKYSDASYAPDWAK
jgi:TRAP-type transport system periplasmic protein